MSIAQHAVESFQEDARNRGLALAARLDDSMPVSGDPERLTQVIYKAHRGRLWFESEGRGGGSTFTLALPLSQSL